MSQEIFEKYGHDPIALYQQWFDEAAPQEVNDPDAINLATADAQGRPSNRYVLLKEISENGFKFHTNTGSEKGQDILENPHVAFTHYWKSTRRQVRVTGLCKPVSAEESDEYFKTRPRARAVGAWASDQSQPYAKSEDLQKAIERAEDQYGHLEDIPRPPEWQGFRIIPDAVEFWMGNRDRLHTRFIYKRDGDKWVANWLFP